jgi:hypothetical protein
MYSHYWTKKIGEIGVDAGIVMVGDPCYRYDNPTPAANDWSSFCAELSHNSGIAGEPLGEGNGFVVHTTYGDGTYPVVGIYDGDTLVGITVMFDTDDDHPLDVDEDDDDDEDDEDDD